MSLLALTATSCGGDDDAEASVDTSTITEGTITEGTITEGTIAEATVTEASVLATDMAVEIADFAFDPAEITLAAGDTVTWTNTDNQAHTATSSGNFDTGSIDPDGTASVTFDEPGTFTYICSFHPFMTATVTVV